MTDVERINQLLAEFQALAIERTRLSDRHADLTAQMRAICARIAEIELQQGGPCDRR